MIRELDGAKKLAAAAGAAGTVLLVVGLFVARERFFKSYLLGFELFLSLSLGALAISMLHHMTGGAWGFVLRRVLEAAMGNLPLLAVLFIPILLGLSDLYPWARPDEVAADPILQHKAKFLNPTFFTARAIFYFAVWCLLGGLLRRWSLEQDTSPNAEALGDRMGRMSGPGVLIYAFTVTFASVDFVMSLEPLWFSTIYPLLMMVIQGLMALAFGTGLGAMAKAMRVIRGPGVENHFHDLGNLLLAFVMLWAYMMLSQYLIIWAGNLPEEISWFIRRTKDSWGAVALVLVIGHFALPFFFLLFRGTKRNVRTLGYLACFLVFMVLVDFLWFVTPAFYPEGISIHWLDLAAIAGVGGIWLRVFFWHLERRPLVPLRAPGLPATFSAVAAAGEGGAH